MPTPADPPTPASVPVPERLPAVGHRLDLIDESGRPVTVIRLKDGTIELHVEGTTTVLDATSARSLGMLASGHFLVRPELLARADAVLGGLELDWVTVPAGGPAVGRSIAELEFRKRTGVTIVAILRGSVPVVDPDPHQRLEAGDELVVACRAEERAALERFLAGTG